MKATNRVIILVSLQIVLIIVSFLVIVHFESQNSLAGKIVNISGKNRVLTSTVLLEMHHTLVYNQTQDEVLESIRILSDNMEILRMHIAPTQMEESRFPAQFDTDWNIMWEKFGKYKTDILYVIKQDTIYDTDIANIEQAGQELIELSDELTEKLGHKVDMLSAELITLQIILGIINVITHIFMITMIWKIFSRYTEKTIKEQKLVTIGEFAASMAHNLKNPLGAMKNSVKRIHTHNEGNNVIKYEITRVDRCINRMSHQIEEVMNYVRTVPIAVTEESIRGILKQSIEMIDIPENVTMVIPENDIEVQCDREKIQVVFANIIRNAIDAIDSKTGNITIRLTEDNNNIIMKFEDSGPSIPEENITKIFEPLYTTRLQGTGLGLASCKNILKSHGGSITVQNNPVTFTVHLPKIQEEQ